MKLNCYFLLLLLPLLAVAENSRSTVDAASAIAKNLQLFKQHGQCNHCNLPKVDLSNFSSSPTGTACTKTLTLVQADLEGANLNNANFTTCLRGTISAFAHIDFSYANLAQASLVDSVFYGVSFLYANLPDAQLSRAQLNLSDFTQANFSHAHLDHAQSSADAMHGWGSVFYLANFCGADLTGANLYGYFQGANFSQAKLHNTTLTSGNDTIPNVPYLQKLTNSGLWAGINFKNADLSGAHFYTADKQPADLSQATFCNTTMPDGSINNSDCQS